MAAPPPSAGFFVNADPVLRATKEKAEKGDKAAALKLYAHYTQVEPNEKEAAYWLKQASDSRIAQSAPPSAPVRTVEIAPAHEPSYTEQSKEVAVKIAEKTKLFATSSFAKLKDITGLGRPKTASTKVFGVALDPQSKDIPIVLARTLDWFAARGVRHENLFRVTPSSIELQALRGRFDAGEAVDLYVVPDPHLVAGVLKLWFQQLPHPFLTYELHDSFLGAARIPEDFGALHALKRALMALPPCHYLCVKYLCGLLDHVLKAGDANGVTAGTIALTFAPNLLRPPPTENPADSLQNLEERYRLLELLVGSYQEVFEKVKGTPFVPAVIMPLKPIAFDWEAFDHMASKTRLGNGKGTETVEVFKALWDFAGGVAGDLPLKAGQTVTLLRRIDNDWWEGESDGRAGVFPAKYVQALTEEERKQYEEEKRRKEAEVEKLRKVGQALKEKLDETAAQRMLDRQRKQQEDEAAEKAIELEELQEEALRKEQQEQLRKKQQAERIALRFSLWVKQLQGATEEELIKQLDEEDAARKEKEAIDAMLRGQPPSPRRVGEKTIAQGGRPKKLRYFAKFERTPTPINRRPRGTGKKHILDIEARKRIEANRAVARALREEMKRKDEERRRQREETMARLAKQHERVEQSIANAKAAASVRGPAPPPPSAKPAPLRQQSVFGELITQLMQESEVNPAPEKLTGSSRRPVMSTYQTPPAAPTAGAAPRSPSPVPSSSAVRPVSPTPNPRPVSPTPAAAAVPPRAPAASPTRPAATISAGTAPPRPVTGVFKPSDVPQQPSSVPALTSPHRPVTGIFKPTAVADGSAPAPSVAKAKPKPVGHRRSKSTDAPPTIPQQPPTVKPSGSQISQSSRGPTASVYMSRASTGGTAASQQPAGVPLMPTARPAPAKPTAVHVPSTFTSLLNQMQSDNTHTATASADTDSAVNSLDELLAEEKKDPKKRP